MADDMAALSQNNPRFCHANIQHIKDNHNV